MNLLCLYPIDNVDKYFRNGLFEIIFVNANIYFFIDYGVV